MASPGSDFTSYTLNATLLETPNWLDTGDNAWQMTAASLVALQSVPGITILYAGLVKRKWAINSMFMTFYAFAAVLVCWMIWAFKVAFGEYMLPFAGRPGPVLTMQWELQQSHLPSLPAANEYQNYPLSSMIYFQFVFAAITLLLIAGGVLARMSLKAWILFVPIWLTFSYCVGAYSIWGGGFLYQLGVIDYSGGYVIHLSSGTAAFTAAYWVGPRLDSDRRDFRPNNIPLAMVGAGILWVGWAGFNGGDPYAASPDAGAAVINTFLTTAVSLLTWTLMDCLFYRKPSIIGAINGMITGLVAITPAAGVIPGWAAIIFGVLSGSVPWVSMNIAGRRSKLFTKYVDDTLGITHTHLVAGFLGGFLTGIFADKEGTAAFGDGPGGGAKDGNGRQVWVQIVGALFIIGWNLVWTSLILLFIKYVCRINLRFTDEELLIGDEALHGEEAYWFNDENQGLVPDVTSEARAIEKLHQIHEQSHEYKKEQVLEGFEAVPSASGSSTHPEASGHPDMQREVKMD